mgnify:CR=1 FL=1|jgi:hypothetical protein
MKYSKFIKYIIKKKINLFDAQSRIIHSKLFNNNNNIQNGGSNKQIIKNIIKNLETPYLKIFLDSVYDNNAIRIKYILNNFI